MSQDHEIIIHANGNAQASAKRKTLIKCGFRYIGGFCNGKKTVNVYKRGNQLFVLVY